MGTSTNQRSPRTPNWKSVEVAYTFPNTTILRTTQEIWRAATNESGGGLVSELRSPIVAKCLEVVQNSNSATDAAQKVRQLLALSGQASLAGEIAQRAAVIAHQSEENRTNAFVKSLFSEASNYLVRRGSTGDTANPDEVIEMALERQSDGNSSLDFEGLEEELYQISSKLYYLNDSVRNLRSRNDRERPVEYIFVGILSGLLVGTAQMFGIDWKLYIAGIFLSSFWVSILASALKMIRFGWIRSVLVSLVISAVFVAISVILDLFAADMLATLGFPSNLSPVWSGLMGMIGGIVAAYLGRGEYEYD